MRLVLLCVLLGAVGCGITNLDLHEPIPKQTVQGSSLPNPLAGFFQFPIDLTIKDDIKAMSTGTASSVKLTAIDLHVDGAGDFSFVDSIDVYVQSSKSGTTLPMVKVASVTSPGAVTTMSFTIVPGVELIDYVNEGVELTTQAHGHEPPADVVFEGTSSFVVDLI